MASASCGAADAGGREGVVRVVVDRVERFGRAEAFDQALGALGARRA